jgi:hypothetical protein
MTSQSVNRVTGVSATNTPVTVTSPIELPSTNGSSDSKSGCDD